jgi:drug/metabolite transporter (DMT)-like permease
VFRDLIRRYSGVTIMKWMFIYAALCYLPFSYGSLTSIDYASVSFDTYMECVYIVLFGTFVSYLCVMPAQQTLRPTVVSMYNYVQPVVASSVAVVVCMDTFGVSKAVAAVLVFSGVYLVTQSKSRAQMEEYERKKSDDNREIEA